LPAPVNLSPVLSSLLAKSSKSAVPSLIFLLVSSTWFLYFCKDVSALFNAALFF
jgi:hypothetical protein